MDWDSLVEREKKFCNDTGMTFGIIRVLELNMKTDWSISSAGIKFKDNSRGITGITNN